MTASAVAICDWKSGEDRIAALLKRNARAARRSGCVAEMIRSYCAAACWVPLTSSLDMFTTASPSGVGMTTR